jgi:peptidoglycan L-alanyl-D-glutamate endopeptidase CwlK
MERKEYDTNRRFLSTVVLCHFAIVGCAVSLKGYAGTATRMKNGQAASIQAASIQAAPIQNDRHHDQQDTQHGARAQSQSDNASRLTDCAPAHLTDYLPYYLGDSGYGFVQALLKNKVIVDNAAPPVVLTDILAGGSPALWSGTNPTLALFDSFSEGADANVEHDRSLAFGELFAPDGILTSRMLFAGALTNSLMSPAEIFGGEPVISQITPDLIARMFPDAARVNIERYWPLMRKALAERGLVDRAMVLMALATVRAETATFNPISETPSPLNTQAPGHPFNKYDRRPDLGNLGPPDGAMFRGRGFIQLTGRKNYGYYGAMLGYDLTSNPDLANAPQPAAQILAAYLKENESPIRTALMMSDLAMARKIINGGSNGLDKFTVAFLIGAQLIRNSDSDLPPAKELQGRRDSRNVAGGNAPSVFTSASNGVKSREKRIDSLADGKSRAKKRDDLPDAKTKVMKREDLTKGKSKAMRREDLTKGKIKAKKRDEATIASNRTNGKTNGRTNGGTDGKSKSKGFFLFRPFRLFRTISSLP